MYVGVCMCVGSVKHLLCLNRCINIFMCTHLCGCMCELFTLLCSV